MLSVNSPDKLTLTNRCAVGHQAVPAAPRGDAGLSSHVVSAATYLGLVYPGRGLEKTIRKEHLNSMTTADFMKVWQVNSRLCRGPSLS